MKDREYWLNRIKIDDKKMLANTDKLVKILQKELNQIKKEIKKELSALEYDDEKQEYQNYQLETILSLVDKLLDDLYYIEVENLNRVLTERYTTIYNERLKAFNQHNDISKKINPLTIAKILAIAWSGHTFYERAKESKRRVAFTVKQEIKAGVLRGDSVNDISRIVSKKLDITLSNAKKLTRTEICHIQTKANIDSFKSVGCTKYEYCAYLDSRTSDICRSLDGKIFDIKDYMSGVNAPPMHQNCRSCILPVMD